MTKSRKLVHPVDAHVGNKLKMRRVELGISQEELGGAVDLTFQQIQKYERAFNRISASKLFDISKILKTNVSYFFNGLDTDYEYKQIKEGVKFAEEHKEYYSDLEGEIKELIQAFLKIRQREIKDNVIFLVKSLTSNEKLEIK